MPDVSEQRDEPRATGRLMRSEHIFNEWCHVMGAGEDWRESLRQSYWRNHVERLEPGDRIHVRTFDCEIRLDIFVIEVVRSAGYLKIGASPVYPHDMRLPVIASSEARPRYGVRRRPGEWALFDVTDNYSDAVVSEGLDRTGADNECRARNQSDQEARNLAARDREEFAVTSVTDDVAPASPGALRTRKYRARQRAEASAA
jgi:hypothetical protein